MLSKTTKNINLVIIILIFLVAVFFYTYGINSEFQGDDDYIYSSGFVGFSNFSRNSILYDINLLGFLRHGPVPSLYFGIFYKIWEVLGLPFSRNAIHFPIALLSAISISLFYFFLRRQKFGLGFALGGALLLLFSPIFTMASRGIATYFASGAVFSQVLGLWAISNLSGNKKSRVIAGLALLHISASDSLFFITLPIFALAYAAKNEIIKFNLAFLKNFARDFWQNIKEMRNWTVSGPWLLIVAFTIATSFLSIIYGLKDTRLSSLLRGHTSEELGGFNSLINFPQRFYSYLAIDFGELFPVFFVLLLILFFAVYKKIGSGFVIAFALFGSIGYGLLFFIISADSFWVKNLYQIYILIPFLLIFLFALKILWEKSGNHKIIAGLILIAAIITSELATMSYVWKKPYAISASIYRDVTHGTNNPNYGTKALGFIMRENLTAIWDADPNMPINLYIKNNNTSFDVFSGVNNPQYFERRYGKIPSLRIISIETAQPLKILEALTQRTDGVNFIILTQAPAPFSRIISYDKVIIDELNAIPNYRVIGGIGVIGAIFIPSENQNLVKLLSNGIEMKSYAIDDLEKRFDEKYRELGDYYPLKK